MNRRLPSGANVRRLKKDVYVSLAYMLAFFKLLKALKGKGECSIGLTAGSGIDGAGEADLRCEGDDAKEDLRLWVNAGGFIGRARDVGVPGMEADGAGEAGATPPSLGTKDLVGSWGAGLWA